MQSEFKRGVGELPKAYNAKDYEDEIYKRWEDSGFFNPDNLPERHKEPFVAAIAPPNITGELHMGHALENALEDILIRAKRMQGYRVLWVPGLDHAGIAAQNVVEKQLKKEGLTRHALGREKFEERVREWKEKYGTLILGQFKKLGISADWSRTRYTRDDGYEEAVREAFRQYREKGWIYKGVRVVNWCPRCATAISDLEVKHIPEKGSLYYIKYGPFTLATARPETKLGDTALAVHPSDERYKSYAGKKLEIESVDNAVSREKAAKKKTITITVVSDEAVDPEFGTGIIKVTPAHDITDSEIGQRHNLSSIKIINEEGRMSENAGARYAGLKVAEARELMARDLAALGLMEKIEEYSHNVGRCDRCDSIVEPLPSEQWFLKVSDLANLAREAIESGEVNFSPPRWKEAALRWLENMRDWNISRQLWWGHKIPIDGEEGVLDTWFSSALWPFAVLGWPKKTPDFLRYYPTHFITSDRGIIFLWQIRMIFSGKFFTGRAPFKTVYIHATVLTKDGRRMSKSLGTGVDPLVLTEKYGTDALRFGLAYLTTELQDVRLGEDTIMMGKKFANKVWNIARYALVKLGDAPIPDAAPAADHDILKKLDETVRAVTESIEKLRFGEAAHILYDFIWHDFADKYIEEAKDKNDPKTKQILAHVLATSLRLLHPFMPFVTEAIWWHLPNKKNLLMVEKWPD